MKKRHLELIADCPLDLGDKVKDEITRLKGTVISLTVHLHGCITCGVIPDGLHEGVPRKQQWFDAPQLKVVKKKAVSKSPGDNGGPKIHGKPDKR